MSWSAAAFALSLAQPAAAAEFLLSPGGTPITGFDGDEVVVWQDWAWECSCQVLDLPEDAELPVEIEAIRLGFGSTDGRWEHHGTSVAVGLRILDAGTDPTKLPGVAEWSWPETWFELAVSSDHLTEIPMTNLLPPTWSLTMKGGRLAVFVCGTDPDEAPDWPIDYKTGQASGPIVDPDLPGEDSWLWQYPTLHRLSDLGISGGWAIQAVASDGRKVPATPFDLLAIEPSTTDLGVVAEVELHGEGLDEAAGATIGGLSLAGFEVVDDETLRGRSPSGLPVGAHDVRVLSAAGDEALLTTAFTVLAVDDGGDGGAEDGGAGDAGADGGADGSGAGCSGCAATGGGGGLTALGVLLVLGLRRRLVSERPRWARVPGGDPELGAPQVPRTRDRD